MYRSGESEYLINGNQCRLRDIKELFMDTGIGVDGYSIIGQGKIQEIVSTKPENRREIFEEAAGVVLYKSRKAEAERKLASASDNLERVKDIIAEIEGRIGTLKDESEKASEYIVLRDRYKYVGVNIIIHNIDGLIRTVENSRNELIEMENQLRAIDERSENIELKIEEIRDKSSMLDQAYEEANAELLEKIEELNTITSRGQVNEEKIQGIERELTRLESVIEETKNKLEAENNNFAELEANEKSYRAEKGQALAALQKAEADFNESKRKLEAINSEIENSKDDIISLSNKNITRKADISTLENYVTTLNDRKEKLSEEYSGKDETDAENARQLIQLEEQYREVENKQNGEQRNGYNQRQAVRGMGLLFVGSGKTVAYPFRQLQPTLRQQMFKRVRGIVYHIYFGFCALTVEGDVSHEESVLARNHRCTFGKLYFGQLRQRNLRSVGCRNQYSAQRFGVIAQLTGIPHADGKAFAALYGIAFAHAADGCFDNALHVAHLYAVACHLLTVELQLDIGSALGAVVIYRCGVDVGHLLHRPFELTPCLFDRNEVRTVYFKSHRCL